MLNRLIFLQAKPLLFILCLVITLVSRMAFANNTDIRLMNASQAGNISDVQKALTAGADINTKLINGVTPLLMASQFGHEAVIKLLLDKGAEVDAKNTQGVTPLMMASYRGYPAVVKLLLEKGADIDANNSEGITSLWKASEQGHTEIVKLLLDKGAKVDAKDAEGTTPLLIVVLNNYIEITRLLLAKDANVNAKRSNGVTPIFIASQEGYTEIVKLLLDKGAKVDEKGFKGITPLWVASQQGHTEVAKLLLAKGAEVDTKGTLGLTPIMMASQKGNKEIVQLLLDKGADINRKVNIDGVDQTTLKLAKQMGQTQIVEILTKAIAKTQDTHSKEKQSIDINIDSKAPDEMEPTNRKSDLPAFVTTLLEPNISGIQKSQVTSKDVEFVAYSDGTIMDSRAKLIWKKDSSNKPLSWEEARIYCEELNYAGYTDWRMPSLDELKGLYNPNNNNYIEATSSGRKWQLLNRCTNLINLPWTTVWASDRRDDQAAHINFSDGSGYGSTLDKLHYVLAVRNIGLEQQIGVKGEGKNQHSQTTSVNLSQISMHPGENTSQEKVKQLYNQALTYEKRGETARAIPVYKEAIELGAKDIDVFLNLALIYKEASQYKEAISVLQNALQRNEEDQSKKVGISKIYNNLGNVYRAQGAYDKAILTFQNALSIDGNLAGPNLNIGITYDVHQEIREKAIPFYLREIEIAPNEKATYEAYLNLGIYYQEITKDYNKSIQYSRHAIKVNPDGFDRYKAYNCIANSLYLKGDVKQAIENWRKVVEMAPNTQSGLYARKNIDALK